MGSKRARTLESQVNTLKKQVSANKKELKYYDGYFPNDPLTFLVDNLSFVKDVYLKDGTTLSVPTFIGRKVHIRRMEIRAESNPGTIKPHGIIWREKRQGKPVNVPDYYPLSMDPEYHTMLRQFEVETNTDKKVFHLDIDFGKDGRLLEFDEQGTAVAQGAIVRGDIKMNWTSGLGAGTVPVSFRVWYTDG